MRELERACLRRRNSARFRLFTLTCFVVTITAGFSCANSPPMRTLDANAERAAAGKALFVVCGSCHGVEGEGRAGIGPRLTSDSFLAAASDDYLIRTISKGRAGTTMIGWRAMYDDEQIASIVTHLRTLNVVAPVKLDESPLKGKPVDGERTFASICSSCHGRTGGGYQESANGTGIGRKSFLQEISNGQLRHLIKNGKTRTAMRAFSSRSTATAVANLTDRQIDEVIGFLRGQAW
jgi:mono/diheme cytochrome c family protein